MHATPSAATVETGDALDALCHGALDALGVLARHARWTDAAPTGASARAGVLVSSLMQAVFVGLCRAMDLSPPDLPSDAEALTDEGFTLSAAARAEALDRVQVDRASGLDADALGRVYESLLGWTLADAAEGPSLAAGHARRRSGSHYTARALTEPIARETLGPLLGDDPTPDAVLALRVCDPAMGAGAFVLSTCRVLAGALVTAWARHGAPAEASGDEDLARRARRAVARRCVYGVDLNPTAVTLARRALWLEAQDPQEPLDFVDAHLRCGDALLGSVRRAGETEAPDDDPVRRADVALACALEVTHEGHRKRLLAQWMDAVGLDVDAFVRGALTDADGPVRRFHWALAFPEVMGPGGAGFDAVVGNPPWVSYAGRAAQPLDDRRRRFYQHFYTSFAGYRNLQGLFVERAGALVRPGGRIGLVLPSSMAELDGYGPTRAAHDRFAVSDPVLPDLGERSFRGVNQPSMVLRSTARPSPLDHGSAAPWPIERPDLDAEALGLLACLDGPPLPPECFGERGLQTASADLAHLKPAQDARHSVPMRVGSDVRAFQRATPSLHADPQWFAARLRPPATYRSVAVLIRQTARVPIAARSDGEGFRNSLLAGFASDALPADALVAWLNATPIRWRHYHRHRDARLGMPQVKIGHLRGVPRPPAGIVGALAAMGAALSFRNTGITDDEQRALDALVCAAFGLSASQQARIARDAARW